MYRALALLGAAQGVLLCSTFAAQSAAKPCSGLAGTTFGAARVLEASEIPAKTTINRSFDQHVMFDAPVCRVVGQITPTPDSDIRFEVWLPAPDSWNGRYEGAGNGGNAGTPVYSTMKMALDGGYAVSGHDTGHVANMGDSDYAIGHPEKVIDFGWRSLHEVAVTSKAVIAEYYGRDPELSLYNGCSTGGRQGLVLAQRFPDDYDGIAVGAPANYWAEGNAYGADFYRHLMEDPSHWVSPEKLAMVEGKVQKACGAIDGIIDNPGACKFDLAQLACAAEATTDCLTEGELASLNQRYAGLNDSKGNLVYPGYTQGSESELSPWWMGTSEAKRGVSSYAWLVTEYFKDYVHGSTADWDISKFDLDADLQAARHGVIGIAATAEDPDLSAFKARGGKILHYHGWHDMAIPANGSLRYYNSVAEKMGGTGELQSFYRLFLGTGMGHCGGGKGPNSFGGAFGKPAPVRDAKHDVIEALATWISTGTAPDQIVATQYDEAGAVAAQRPWCVHPQVAVWDGTGDRKSAASYKCEVK